MNTEELKSHFLQYLKKNNKEMPDESDNLRIDFITRKIIERKIKCNGEFILTPSFNSDIIIATILDGVKGGNGIDIMNTKTLQHFFANHPDVQKIDLWGDDVRKF